MHMFNMSWKGGGGGNIKELTETTENDKQKVSIQIDENRWMNRLVFNI